MSVASAGITSQRKPSYVFPTALSEGEFIDKDLVL